MVADPRQAGLCYGFGSEFILRSRDAGQTWDDATAFRPDPAAKPSNWRGRGWTGWCANGFAFNPFREGQSVLLAMDGARGWLSDDGLASWRFTMGQSNPWIGGQSAAFSKDGHLYITTGQDGQNNGILHSDDGGATWKTLSGAARGLPSSGWGSKGEYSGVYAHPENGAEAWALLSGALLATTNAGASWARVPGVSNAWQLAADPTAAGRFYLTSMDGLLARGPDGGLRNLGKPGLSKRGRVSCDALGRVLVCQWRQGESGLWRYDPRSAEWSLLRKDALAFVCKASPADPRRLLLGTSDDPYHEAASGNGVWQSADDGATWARANDGLPMLRVTALDFNPFDPAQIVLGSFGRGFYQTRWR
jgi:photosystem II stability/assembly factor-like uncharacterized protein